MKERVRQGQPDCLLETGCGVGRACCRQMYHSQFIQGDSIFWLLSNIVTREIQRFQESARFAQCADSLKIFVSYRQADAVAGGMDGITRL